MSSGSRGGFGVQGKVCYVTDHQEFFSKNDDVKFEKCCWCKILSKDRKC